MPESKIQFKLDGVAHLLQDRLLAVPIYQRSYSWEIDEVADFWADLAGTMPRTNNEYFLGTIVLTKEGPPGRETIIDGQRRLATTAILLSAIREEFRERGDTARADILGGQYLAKLDLETAEGIPGVCLNSEDDTYFRTTILRVDPSLPSIATGRRSHELIAEASDYLRARVTEAANAAGASWKERLLAWVDYLTKSVVAMVVEVPSEADAFMIFETLNDRGADLTIADLLKNYLFGRSGNMLDVVRDAWLRALGALEITAENSLFTTFLRHYWSSKYGATRERDLYRAIKDNVHTQALVVAFAEDLSKSASDYAALLNSDHEAWSTLGSAAKDNVESVLRLNLEQNRPLLLAALQHLPPAELKRLLQAIVAWSVRGLVVGGIGGGTTERAYCEAAVKIRKGEITTARGVHDELAPIIATDEVFEKSFAIARVPRSAIARYYLLALERAEDNQAEPELVPNANEDEVNLEHILPRNPSGHWSGFTDDQAKDLVNRLGNMVLLKKATNRRLGAAGWTAKRPKLQASELKLTQMAGAVDNWTPDAIQDRQAKLAELAVTAWPRRPR
jgi:DNA-directed RNA polymerase specialized sigma24 family protein